jgi:hypothetical protein
LLRCEDQAKLQVDTALSDKKNALIHNTHDEIIVEDDGDHRAKGQS